MSAGRNAWWQTPMATYLVMRPSSVAKCSKHDSMARGEASYRPVSRQAARKSLCVNKVRRNEHIALVREHTKATVAKTELDVLRADETITVGIESCK